MKNSKARTGTDFQNQSDAGDAYAAYVRSLGGPVLPSDHEGLARQMFCAGYLAAKGRPVSLLAPIPDWGLALIALTGYLGCAYGTSRLYFRAYMADEDRAKMTDEKVRDVLQASIFAGVIWPAAIVVIVGYNVFSLIFGGWTSSLRKIESRTEKARRLEQEHREAMRAAAAQATQDQQEKAALQRRIDLLERLNQVGPYAPDGGRS